MGVDECTVSKWAHGDMAPGDDNWAKLQALKDSLIQTGTLVKTACNEVPVKSCKVSEKTVAKNTKSPNPLRERVREVDREIEVNSKPLKGKGKHTVLQQEAGVALCHKCPFKGQPMFGRRGNLHRPHQNCFPAMVVAMTK